MAGPNEVEPVRPDRRWIASLARVVFNLWVSGVCFWAGAFGLRSPRPNAWIAGGLAIFFWTFGFVFVDRLRDLRPGSTPHTTLLWRLRIQFAGYLIAACLSAVGSAIHGGAIGILGVAGALFAGSWCLWLLQQLAKAR